MEYTRYNTELLNLCLNDVEQYVPDKAIRTYIKMALNKVLNPQAVNAVPPLLGRLVFDDLNISVEGFSPLFAACAYFYTAADLLDDIQDKDPEQPVLQHISPEQALNISNYLLMMAYKSLGELTLPPSQTAALFALFTQMGMRMSTGQFWDIAATNTISPSSTPQEIATYKAGAELAGFMACAPCALGLDPNSFYLLGEKIGVLLQLLSDYMDIWMVSHPQALSEDLSVLKNTLPLYNALQDPQWAHDVQLAVAGDNSTSKKQFALRRLLAKTTAIEALESTLSQLKSDIDILYTQLPSLPRIQGLIQLYVKQTHELLEGLKKLRQITQPAQRSPNTLQSSIRMATEYLHFIPKFQDVWEVQRWGFLGKDTLYGNIFNPLLILEALKAQGENIESSLKNILRQRSKYGWHYYSNSDLIPPDTDDLAQILQLGADLSPTDRNQWIEPILPLLFKNIEDSGKCPTWLSHPKAYPREHIDQQWFGNECVAVMANLYYGLSCYSQHHTSTIRQGIDYIASLYDPQTHEWPSTHYPSKLYTLYLVGRLFQKQAVDFDFKDITDHVMTQQLLNGSWNDSPQETAFALLFLGTLPMSSVFSTALTKGRLFILEHQDHDGSWPGENLFIRPGRDARYAYFQHPKLTTAFCLRAIHNTHL